MYRHISEISMALFIDAVTRNPRAVVKDSGREYTDSECEKAASVLMMQYVDACGGSSLGAKIEQERRKLMLQVRMNLLSSCRALVRGCYYSDVLQSLSVLGYRYQENEHEKIVQKIDQLIKRCQFDIDTLSDGEHEADSKSSTKSDFARERVLLMTHYKMHIDTNVYTAEEYAYLVNQFNREYEEARKRNAARTNRRI